MAAPLCSPPGGRTGRVGRLGDQLYDRTRIVLSRSSKSGTPAGPSRSPRPAAPSPCWWMQLSGASPPQRPRPPAVPAATARSRSGAPPTWSASPSRLPTAIWRCFGPWRGSTAPAVPLIRTPPTPQPPAATERSPCSSASACRRRPRGNPYGSNRKEPRSDTEDVGRFLTPTVSSHLPQATKPDIVQRHPDGRTAHVGCRFRSTPSEG